jgi:hypothetical protein
VPWHAVSQSRGVEQDRMEMPHLSTRHPACFGPLKPLSTSQLSTGHGVSGNWGDPARPLPLPLKTTGGLDVRSEAVIRRRHGHGDYRGGSPGCDGRHTLTGAHWVRDPGRPDCGQGSPTTAPTLFGAAGRTSSEPPRWRPVRETRPRGPCLTVLTHMRRSAPDLTCG